MQKLRIITSIRTVSQWLFFRPYTRTIQSNYIGFVFAPIINSELFIIYTKWTRNNYMQLFLSSPENEFFDLILGANLEAD